MTYFDNDRFTSPSGALIFLICSGVLFLGAIAVFVWLIVDSAEEHMVKNVLYGSAFLVITLGLLLYSLFVPRAPRTMTVVLWISMALGIATFIVGMVLKAPEPSPVIFDDGTPQTGIYDDSIPHSDIIDDEDSRAIPR